MKASELVKMASQGLWENIDLSQITPQMLEKLYIAPSGRKMTLVAIAADSGKLHLFPKEFITVGSLTQPDSMGESALHFAGIRGQLKHIPKSLLTKDTLVTRRGNREGTLPLHYAILHGNLDQIPKEVLTPEVLSAENNHGFAPIDFAIFSIKATGDEEFYVEEDYKKSLRQIRFILSRLDFITLELYLQRPTKNSYDKDMRAFVEKELLARKLKKAIPIEGLELGV